MMNATEQNAPHPMKPKRTTAIEQRVFAAHASQAVTRNAGADDKTTQELAPHEVLQQHFGGERWPRIVSQARAVMGWDEAVLHRLCKELLERQAANYPGHADYVVNAAACALLVCIHSKVGPNDEARLVAAREAMRRATNG